MSFKLFRLLYTTNIPFDKIMQDKKIKYQNKHFQGHVDSLDNKQLCSFPFFPSLF